MAASVRGIGLVLTALLAFGPGAPAAAAATYSIVDLGASFGRHINSWAYDINASGQVVIGAGDGGQDAWLYDNTGMHNLGKSLGYESRPYAINDAGQVVGSLRRVDEEGTVDPARAFLFDRTGVYDLGSLAGDWSWASDINASGQIVGYGHPMGTGSLHAFLYSNGVMQDLGTLGGSTSYANAINNLGQVVGQAYVSDRPQVEHAFLYDNGDMRDLGALGTGSVSNASDINVGVTQLHRKGESSGDEPGSPVRLHGSRQPSLDTN